MDHPAIKTHAARARSGALYLGVDGGGTGCRARIETAEGRVLGIGRAGPAAVRFGVENVWRAIETAFHAAASEAGITDADFSRIHAGIGLAGFSREGAAQAFAVRTHPFASIHFASDATTACIGAHNGADGGIVIVGTGSCGVARVGGTEIKIGGWGYPVSDEGSGADLGLRALAMALHARDGRIAATPLLDEIMGRFEGRQEKVVAWMDRATPTDYASFAPLVVHHANADDANARHLMQDAGQRIEDICHALLERGAPRLALLGGLGSVIEEWMSSDMRGHLVTPVGDAIDGAAILAGRMPRAGPHEAD